MNFKISKLSYITYTCKMQKKDKLFTTKLFTLSKVSVTKDNGANLLYLLYVINTQVDPETKLHL